MVQKDSLKDYLLEIPNYFSLFIFPLFFLSLSPILIDISESTGIEIGALTLIFTFYIAGSVAGQLTSILYNRRFKSLIIIIASFVILIPVALALAQVKDKYSFYSLYFIGGYFFGVIWVQVNKSILRSRIKNKDRLVTLTLSFFPAGALIAPYLSSVIVRNGIDWQVIYYILTLLIIIVIILYITITRKIDYLSLKPDKKILFKKIFTSRSKNIIFILILLMMAVYMIPEIVIATWAPTFFRIERLFTIGEGALIGTLFWAGIIVGRIIGSIIAGKIKVHYYLLILSIIGLISSIVIYFLESKIAIYAIMVIIGFGFSSIFPLMISFGTSIYRSGKGLLITIMFTVTNVGVLVTPTLIRYLSQYGMPASVSPVPVFLMVFIILAVVLIIYSRRAKTREEIS